MKRIEKERKEEEAKRKAMENMSEEEKLKAEDEEYRKRRKRAVDAVEKEILGRVYKKTFGNLTDRDWEIIQKKWEKYAGK